MINSPLIQRMSGSQFLQVAQIMSKVKPLYRKGLMVDLGRGDLTGQCMTCSGINLWQHFFQIFYSSIHRKKKFKLVLIRLFQMLSHDNNPRVPPKSYKMCKNISYFYFLKFVVGYIHYYCLIIYSGIPQPCIDAKLVKLALLVVEI